ncbi:hypothetical protein [Lutibacter sp.]
MKKSFILIITLFSITTTLFSQTNKKFIDTGSVKNQFDYLINKSNRYQEFKVVKINWLNKLKSNVNDSLSVSKKELLNSFVTINSQKKTIDSLKVSLANSKNNITALTKEKQSISLFGIQLGKSFFKTLLFSIIGILAVLLVFFIIKFKQSNSITSQAKLDLKEVEEEFDTHRKKALEREQKVMRKLQDELNKQKKE